ncbi:MAG: hypothetical protein LBV17_03865 [Treponema sp.]|jgi:hypothetical protein|nr:hypothetical protein [Treponema sp.]
MNFFYKIFILSFFLSFASARLHALEVMNIWRHSEIAGKNSLFCDIGLAPLVFDGLDFPILPVDIRLEYMPPLPLPFSIGIFLKTPNPNLNSFGIRGAYHFDLLDDVTDLFIVYSFDFGFLRNDLLLEYNDTPVDKHFYDFRIGVRRFFGQWLGLVVETGFKFESIIFLLSIKIN